MAISHICLHPLIQLHRSNIITFSDFFHIFRFLIPWSAQKKLKCFQAEQMVHQLANQIDQYQQHNQTHQISVQNKRRLCEAPHLRSHYSLFHELSSQDYQKNVHTSNIKISWLHTSLYLCQKFLTRRAILAAFLILQTNQLIYIQLIKHIF